MSATISCGWLCDDHCFKNLQEMITYSPTPPSQSKLSLRVINRAEKTSLNHSRFHDESSVIQESHSPFLTDRPVPPRRDTKKRKNYLQHKVKEIEKEIVDLQHEQLRKQNHLNSLKRRTKKEFGSH